ncbi:MAG: hypothetical protein A2552_07400 [Sulfuricurvum sp. RIFOXYD2_FULL_44_160]|uniref:DUF58 domain-containing protein n=1 Tax=Sulfuricurvum sp. RIFOXYD2_FULL_44_160 TaxID=1802249 RepID=UPI0008BABA08|nr:DUF58 domain-containing protein [Sulfuricurvum sp. RIFOXYD2_FULL_44_160]OHD93949.1 MAG: hypothetical protein A2552_07400 [Sulfuricurvum sp. RIFOXYD2_FULL_44_160]
MKNSAQILLKARRQIIGDRIGNNPSMFRGEGYDFIELREYISGDDTRHIDWNVTAKMGKPYVKVFREERELNVLTVALLGGGLHFGSEKFKIESVAEAVALIGYSAVANGDVFGHCNYSENLRNEIRPAKKRFSVQQATQSVLDAEILHHRVDLHHTIKELYRRTKRRSLIVLIGDFFEIPDLRFLARKHEVVAVVVRDRAEENPSEMGFTALIDPESGAVLEGDFNERSVKRYHDRVKAHDIELFESFRVSRVRATKLYTDANAVVTLRRLFEGRV